jgi:cell wall assembly regulator SMI1
VAAKTLVDRLDWWLAQNRPAYHAQLRPGLSAAQLTEFEGFVGFDFPDAFRLLYRWHDGQADDSLYYLSLCHNQSFMTSDEVKRRWEMLTSMMEADQWGHPQWWHRGWIPFLHNGSGSHLCLDLHGSFTGTPGQVIEFWVHDRDRPVVAPSLEAWLGHFVSTLEAGLWSLDDGGNFSYDFDAFPEIPGYPIVGDASKRPGGKPLKPRRRRTNS